MQMGMKSESGIFPTIMSLLSGVAVLGRSGTGTLMVVSLGMSGMGTFIVVVGGVIRFFEL